MLGLSLRDVALHRPGNGRTITPAPGPAPTMLPALTTPGASYLAVASTERLVEGYVGPLVGAGGQDFGGTRVSRAAVAAARGAAVAVRIATLYDQTGRGNHYVQADAALQFGLSDHVTAAGGALPIIVDGRRNASGGIFRTMTSPASVAGRAFTRAVAIEPTDSIIPQLLISQGGHHLFTMHSSNDGNPVESSSGVNFGVKVPASAVVLIHRERSDGQDLFYGGVKVSRVGVPAAGPLPLRLGGAAGLEDFTPNLRVLADVVVDGALSDADCAAIDAALRDRFGLAAWGANARVVMIGDSIGEGVGSTLTRGPGFYARPLIGVATDWWVIAVGGKSLAQCHADRATFEGQITAPDTGRPIVAVLQGGINDILGGIANLYADVTTPYVGYLKGQGKKVVVCTLLPQTANVDPAIEQARQSYNTQVRANAAGADAICDLAANTVMGRYPAAPNDPTLYPDGIHPSSLGYSHLAQDLAAAIGPLATTP